MATKRKVPLQEELKSETLKESEDEALGNELNLNSSDDDDDDDSDSSVYSDLEDEDDEDSEVDESEEESSSDEEREKEEGQAEELDNRNRSNEADEYEYDSSDEEDIRNTIGNIPVNWYDDYNHIGYGLDGQKIRKPKRGDELENFLSRMENPEHGATVEDSQTGQKVVLSELDAEIVSRSSRNKVPQPGYDLYTEAPDWFSRDVMQVPLRDIPESKKSFLPSHHERLKVGKMVHAIKMGWMKPRPAEKSKEEDGPKYYMLWQTDDQVEDPNMRRIHDNIPAPKMFLPGHEESYNPPPEYLFSDKEKASWEKATREGDKRKLPFIPQKYSSLRKVPAWSNFTRERFERCLDLYLAPRQRKMRLTIQPEDLVPQLPRPRDLQPFPTVCSLTFRGHNNMIRCLRYSVLSVFRSFLIFLLLTSAWRLPVSSWPAGAMTGR